MADTLADPIEQILEEALTSDGELLICRACHHPITTNGEKITVGLSHHYRFTNPAGISFSVGCYRNAPGCAILGEPTERDSWFGGYTWQLALCSECQAHLGWYYQSPRPRCFFGLIPERLIQQAQGDAGT